MLTYASFKKTKKKDNKAKWGQLHYWPLGDRLCELKESNLSDNNAKLVTFEIFFFGIH